jgi:hypothetical protein
LKQDEYLEEKKDFHAYGPVSISDFGEVAKEV